MVVTEPSLVDRCSKYYSYRASASSRCAVHSSQSENRGVGDGLFRFLTVNCELLTVGFLSWSLTFVAIRAKTDLTRARGRC